MLKELLWKSAPLNTFRRLCSRLSWQPEGLIEDGLAQLVRLGYLAEGSRFVKLCC